MAFIVFEGLDGSGKSTLMENVQAELQSRGLDFILTQDPGSTEVGLEVRKIILQVRPNSPVPKAELLLYQAARAQMVDQVIQPALDQGRWVLADRFTSSTWAFQAYARSLAPQMVESLNKFVTGDCHPDLFIFLDITVEESARRKKQRVLDCGEAEDRIELEKASFHKKVRAGYLEQAQKQPERWLVLDGTRSREQLCRDVVDELVRKSWLG